MNSRPQRNLNNPDLVLFDLDGTLIDSVPDLAYSLDMMLEQLGRPAQAEDKIREWVGKGAEQLVHCALRAASPEEPETALFKQAFELFSDIYADNTSQRSKLYPGALEAINYLLSRDYQLGCITNKRERFTHPLLKSFGLFEQFSIVVSGDTLPQKKPDPRPLLHATDVLGVHPSDAVMVGDSINDVHAARAAGMPAIGVRYGYNHGENIESAKPDAVLDSLAELKHIL